MGDESEQTTPPYMAFNVLPLIYNLCVIIISLLKETGYIDVLKQWVLETENFSMFT